MIEKLLSGWNKSRKPKEEQEQKPSIDEELLNSYKQKLKGIVYDDELVEQYAPIFAKLHEHDAEGSLIDLLENKEKQIQAIADGSAFKEVSGQDGKDTEIEQQQSDKTEDDISVESFITNRGK